MGIANNYPQTSFLSRSAYQISTGVRPTIIPSGTAALNRGSVGTFPGWQAINVAPLSTAVL